MQFDHFTRPRVVPLGGGPGGDGGGGGRTNCETCWVGHGVNNIKVCSKFDIEIRFKTLQSDGG